MAARGAPAPAEGSTWLPGAAVAKSQSPMLSRPKEEAVAPAPHADPPKPGFNHMPTPAASSHAGTKMATDRMQCESVFYVKITKDVS